MAAIIEHGEVSFTETKSEVFSEKSEIVTRTSELSILPAYFTKEFKCRYPTVDPNVVRVTQPLPFPDSLKDVIAWTDAFVDRIASLTLAQEQKVAREKKEQKTNITKLHEKVRELNADLDAARKDALKAKADAKKAAEEAKKILETTKTELRAQTAKTDAAEKKAAAEKARADDLYVKLQAALANDKSDSDKIQNLNCLLGTVKHQRDEFRDMYNDGVAKLITKQTELANSKADVARLTNDVSQREEIIRGLKTTIAQQKTTIETLEVKLQEVKCALNDVSQKFADLKINHDNSLKKVEELSNKLNEANVKIDYLTAEVKKLTADKATEVAEKEKALAELAELKTTHDLLKADLKLLQKNQTINDLKLKSAEENVLRFSEALKQANLEKHRAEERAKAAESSLQIEKDTQRKETEDALLMEQLKSQHLQSRLDEANTRVVPVAVGGHRVNILSVEYGGKAYTYENNKSVLEKLYNHADERTSFDISNQFFEGDPLHGIKKTASITYQLSSGGAPLQIVGVEYTKAKFN